MPKYSLSQFLTGLATNADLFAAFLAGPAQLARVYLSPADSEALLSGDPDSIFQSLCRGHTPMPQAPRPPAPVTALQADPTEVALIGSAVLHSTFKLFD
jgi:hypothetical protein